MFTFAFKFALVIWAVAIAVSMATPAPRWLREKIKEIETQHPQEELEISKWKFEGKTVYVLPARCCDIPGEVVSSKGTLICRLEGGFSGQADERCKDFRQVAQRLDLVWKSKPNPKP